MRPLKYKYSKSNLLCTFCILHLTSCIGLWTLLTSYTRNISKHIFKKIAAQSVLRLRSNHNSDINKGTVYDIIINYYDTVIIK